jgi:uncharacterized integral membrane protein
VSEPEPQRPPETVPAPPATRQGISLHAVLMIVVLVALIALLLANTRTVKVSWVFGSTRQALVWIVLVTAILGWLLGIFTSIFFHRRRARTRSSKAAGKS